MAVDIWIASVVHVLFAAIWTGSIVFVTYGVLPVARAGNIDTDPFADITSRLLMLSRFSVLVLFLTGGHLAGRLYTVETLTGSTDGYLVLAMLGLWFVLAGLIEVGTKRISSGIEERKLRAPANNAWPFFLAGTVVSVGLLAVAGLIAGGFGV